MSKTENELKTELVKKIRAVPGWYARRLEDQYAVGLPDMLVGMPDGPGFLIEAKRVEHQSFGPTPRQMIDLLRWEDGKSRGSVLLGFKEGRYYLHPVAERAIIGGCVAGYPGESFNDQLTRYWKLCQMTGK